ncbi:iron uptake porin [Leptolyngbya sp. FACHB-321]|uniref:iron uptake porin n=1 Tax=Leptolyngbya sp. FACHB-321 TaxID=2692807 RepID=UPI001F54961B|nr:iron uptake porin [Leptolyngbya sp. FACHB-321]
MMTKLFWGALSATLTLLSSGLLLETPAMADSSREASAEGGNPHGVTTEANSLPMGGETTTAVGLEQSLATMPEVEPSAEELIAEMEQVTSVSQLTDVQPTDWAFQALQSLVERYGCIVGYPDRTYRGNRALTRYEFAAGLNACMDRISELIAAGTADLVKKEDLLAVQKMQEEFAAELATLRGHVGALEVRSATLEKQQFSTTTKISTELITYVADAFGDRASPLNNANIGHRLRLDFDTSFTGKDRLRTRLQATNLRKFNVGDVFGVSPVGRATSDLSDETRFLATSTSSNSEVTLNRLQYRFPIGEKLTVFLDANTIDPSIVTDPITPFNDQATGALSNFAQINPVWFPLGNQAGVAVNYAISPNFQFDFGYQAEGGSPNDPQLGLFNAGYSAFAHLIVYSGTFKLGFFYMNSYSPQFGVDTLAGSNAAKILGAGPVVGNGYSVEFDYRINSWFELGGWVGLTQARTLGTGTRGDANVWNFALNLAFPDLGKKGNLGGIVFGMQPKLTGTSNAAVATAIGLPEGQREDRDTGYHIEAFYRYQLTDNLSITPGFIWLTAPNHDSRNPDAVIGVIRTTFVF